MSDYTVTATIVVSGEPDDERKIQAAVDAGLVELTSIARRYGFTITKSSASVDVDS